MCRSGTLRPTFDAHEGILTVRVLQSFYRYDQDNAAYLLLTRDRVLAPTIDQSLSFASSLDLGIRVLMMLLTSYAGGG